MATQAMACTTALADYHCNLPRRVGSLRRLPQIFASSGLDSYPQIVIVIKVLVQSKNLLEQKGIPKQCLDDANTSQHLSLPGRLLM
jgi:hypothetical protein